MSERSRAESSESLYDANDYYGADRQGSRLAPIFNFVLQVLDWGRAFSALRLTRLRKGARVLDVGAGDGKFLHQMQRQQMMVRGTTASRISKQAALRLYQIHLELTESLAPMLDEGPFDLVTYWHVFEHLEHPSEHLESLKKLIRPGGHLIIEVPNMDSLGASICYRSWLGSDDLHHINHQKPGALVAAIEAAGFKVLRREVFSLKFSYVYLWSALLGRFFGAAYEFDQVMDILKHPIPRDAKHWLRNFNAYAALLYLSPLIAVLMAFGVFSGRGEVFRLYATN